MHSGILVIDDDQMIGVVLRAILNSEGYQVHIAHDYDDALALIDSVNFQVIFMDIVLGRYSGLEILKEIKLRGVNTPVVMITGEPSLDTASDALRLGAFDYLPKPLQKNALIRVAKHALQHKALLDEKEILTREMERCRMHLEAVFMSVQEAIISVDPTMRLLQYNNAFAALCPLPAGYLTGRDPSCFMQDCSGACWSILRQALEGKRSVHEHRIECGHRARPEQTAALTISPLMDQQEQYLGAVMTIRDVTRLSRLEAEFQQRCQVPPMVGNSKKMQDIYALIENVKDIDTTVLITGPSGTGKELVARAVHNCGARACAPFVVVNCSALAENLLESELFGHVKGAFTGAFKDKTGRFQMAGRGTIFLDEIGDISPMIQLKLLRVLETKVIERVGEGASIKIDVRIVTATNQDLKQLVREGRFREDLYYRLKVVEIKTAPLIERREDIPLLVEYFLARFADRFHKHIKGVSVEVSRFFMEYAWPGNIRELQHMLEHAFIMCQGSIIETRHLPLETQDGNSGAAAFFPAHIAKLPRELMKEDVISALEKNRWNKAQAAHQLGISRPTLYKIMRDYDIANAAGNM